MSGASRSLAGFGSANGPSTTRTRTRGPQHWRDGQLHVAAIKLYLVGDIVEVARSVPTRGLPPTLNSYNGLHELIEPVSQAQMEVIREKVQGLLTSCGEYAELLGAIRDVSEQSHDTAEQTQTTYDRERCNLKARELLSAVESVSAASEWFLRTLDERERAETSARSSAAAGRSMPPSAPGDAETTTALGLRSH